LKITFTKYIDMMYIINNETKGVLKMKGTDKQVKWALDIQDNIRQVLSDLETLGEFLIKPKRKEKYMNQLAEWNQFVTQHVLSIDDAGVMINAFKDVSSKKTLQENQGAICYGVFRKREELFPGYTLELHEKVLKINKLLSDIHTHEETLIGNSDEWRKFRESKWGW
jgi:hypothetical protein